MKYVVTLAPGKQVGVGAYARAWKEVRKARPNARFENVGFTPWAESAADLLYRFRYGLHDRINQHIPGYGKGRKWSPNWQADTWNAARRVNTPRLLVRESEVPYWLRSRVGHRISGPEDI
jgi:hypothetical protein